MKFLYRYQDKERGVLEGEIVASSESDAYSALRKGGIRPMKVWPKPGVINAVARLGKRGAAIIVLGVLCVVLGITLHSALRAPRSALLAALPRQQVSAPSVDFTYKAERTLALFACPGDIAPLESAAGALDMSDLAECLGKPIECAADDPEPVTVLKRIVIGLKEEAAMLVKSGKSAEQVLDYLVSRQRMEADYRRLAVQRVMRSPSERVKVNENLEQMGMAKITAEEEVKEK